MYDNKYTNLVTAGNFYFPFSYFASLFLFILFWLYQHKEKKNVLYSNKNLDKRIYKSYTIN